MSEQFTIVDGTDNAKNLIFATWLKSYEVTSAMTKLVPRQEYFAGHHKLIEGIFARNPSIKLAVLPDDHNVILGWGVGEPGIIHYIFVKQAMRRFGLGRALLLALTNTPHFTYTHHTHILRTDLAKYVEKATFNPYRA